MSRSQPPLQQHLLTRSDLARMGVPAGEILGWLAEGDIEQVGALAGSHGEDPVFAVAPRLRSALSDRLAQIGKTAVVLSPLRVRSFLLRSLLRGAHPPLDAPSELPPQAVPSEVPVEALTQHLLTTDLAEVLHEAAADLDADVAAMLQLAQEEAQLERTKAMEATAAAPDEEPPAYVDAPPTDEDLDAEGEECFDVDDLRELLGDFEDEPEPAQKSDEATFGPAAHDAIQAPAPRDALVSPEVGPSRNEPILDTSSPPAADPVQEFTMPSTHHAHPEDALEPAHEEASVDTTPVAAEAELEQASQAEPTAAASEADERTALTEAAAVLEQLLGEDSPSTPFLEPSEIQSALAALDIDEPAPTRRAAVAEEVSIASDTPDAEATAPPDGEPKAEAPGADTPNPTIPSPEGRSEPTSTSEAGLSFDNAGTGTAEASAVAASDDAHTMAIEPPASEGAAPTRAQVADDVAASTADEATPRASATPMLPQAEPSAGPARSTRSVDPTPPADELSTAGNGHEVLGAAMQRVDAFLDRLKAALVEMAARPATPAPAPMPLPTPAAPSLDIAPLVGAIDGGFAKTVQQSEAAAHALTGLAERIDGLGQRLEATTGAKVAALTAPATNTRPAPPQFVMPSSSAMPWVLFAVAGLVTAWSVLFWFKTGSPRLALGTLVGANLVGCCLLAGRR